MVIHFKQQIGWLTCTCLMPKTITKPRGVLQFDESFFLCVKLLIHYVTHWYFCRLIIIVYYYWITEAANLSLEVNKIFRDNENDTEFWGEFRIKCQFEEEIKDIAQKKCWGSFWLYYFTSFVIGCVSNKEFLSCWLHVVHTKSYHTQ